MEPSKILKFRNGLLLREGEEALAEEIKPEEWEDWTNREGQKMTAKYLKMENGKVSFELKGEKKVAYPLEQLSEESQKRIMQRVKTDAAPEGGIQMR
jgi:hypothetical protein